MAPTVEGVALERLEKGGPKHDLPPPAVAALHARRLARQRRGMHDPYLYIPPRAHSTYILAGRPAATEEYRGTLWPK